MSELNKKALLVSAIAAAFISNPKEEILHVTPDGNCFKEVDKGHAAWHAKSTNQELLVVNREDFEIEIEKNIADQEQAALEAKELADKALAEAKEAKDAILKAKEDQEAKDKADAEKSAADLANAGKKKTDKK